MAGSSRQIHHYRLIMVEGYPFRCIYTYIHIYIHSQTRTHTRTQAGRQTDTEDSNTSRCMRSAICSPQINHRYEIVHRNHYFLGNRLNRCCPSIASKDAEEDGTRVISGIVTNKSRRRRRRRRSRRSSSRRQGRI